MRGRNKIKNKRKRERRKKEERMTQTSFGFQQIVFREQRQEIETHTEVGRTEWKEDKQSETRKEEKE